MIAPKYDLLHCGDQSTLQRTLALLNKTCVYIHMECLQCYDKDSQTVAVGDRCLYLFLQMFFFNRHFLCNCYIPACGFTQIV